MRSRVRLETGRPAAKLSYFSVILLYVVRPYSPVFAVHYGSEIQQLQDKVKELEKQLQEMRATLETLKPPQ